MGVIWLCLLFSFNSYSETKFNTQKRYLYIQEGQSIYSIVGVLYPGMRKYWVNIINQVVADNPHAFIGRNAAKIKVGERIVLPVVNFKPRRSRPVQKKAPPVIIQVVGEVVAKKGNTFALSKKEQKRTLALKSKIYVGDRIFTGVEAFIRLKMIDDAKIDLRCNSEMLIEDYQMKPGANKSVIQLVKGSVKKETGIIGQSEGDIYEMRTPVATIGVRGTEYVIRVLQQHGCDGSLDVNNKGLFVKVKRGAIDVASKIDVQAVNQGEIVHLLNDKSPMKKMATDNGIFEKPRPKPKPVEKKRNFIGSLMWLIFLLPAGCLLRKFNNVKTDIQQAEQQRLDKWLWAARFFKTRKLAADAVSGGKVHVNGARVKPSRTIKVGDNLEISSGQFEFKITIEALNKHRRPASEAKLLYSESEESVAKRQEMAQQLKILHANMPHCEKRPSKKQRRQIVRFKRVED